MKKIFSIFAALLFAGSMMATTITLTGASGFKSSYGTAGTLTVSEVQFAYNEGVMYNGKGSPVSAAAKSFIQLRKSGSGAGEIKNDTELSLKSITIATQNTNAFTLSAGTAADDLASVDPSTSTGKYAFKDKDNADAECDVTIYTFNVEGKKYFDILNGTGALYIAYITIELGAAPAVATPSITADADPFVGSTNVNITCATAGSTIYFTTNGDDPTDASEVFSAPFTINATTTIKAFAINGTDTSKIAEKTFTAEIALTTMDQIFADAEIIGSTAADRFITFDDWIVSGVTSDGKTAYVTDGTKGFIVYTNAGHNLGRDDVLSGTAKVSLKLYKGAAEIVGLTSTTTGLTVNPGGLLDPTVLDADGIATLSGVNTGGLFTIDGAYEYFSEKDHVAGLQVHNGLYTYAAFETGYNYQLTGVYLQYDATGEIMPRQSTDIDKGGAASRIIADDVNLGTITTTGEWRDITIDVTTENVSYAVTIFETSDNLNIIPDETYLDAAGGTIKASLDLTKAGNYVATIDLRAGEVKRVVKITAKVIIQHEIPTSDTSDPKVEGVTQASNAKVKIQVSGVDSVTYDAIKLGNSSTGGTMTIKVGAGAERLYFYAAAWASTSGNINVSAPAGVTLSAGELVDGKLTLIADDGIANNSPFKLAKKLDDAWIYLFEIELDGVTEATTITLSSGTAKRFVVWGAKQYKGTATSIENAVVNENKAVKQIMNGQVIIIRNGVRYNVIGQVIE